MIQFAVPGPKQVVLVPLTVIDAMEEDEVEGAGDNGTVEECEDVVEDGEVEEFANEDEDVVKEDVG